MQNLAIEEFERLLSRLDDDRSRAAEKYLILRRKLVKIFERRGCVAADDLADQALDRIARKLEKEEIHDLASFAHGVALMICREFHKNNKKVVFLLDEFESDDLLVGDPDPENRIAHAIGGEQEATCLQNCLRKLPPGQHELMIAYYEGERSEKIELRQQLARDRGISTKCLRDQANWLRARLRMCVKQCLRNQSCRAKHLNGHDSTPKGDRFGAQEETK